MKIPCAARLPFIVSGPAFLQPALANSQFYNLTLTATVLVLGSKFCLSEINRMRLEEKCVSTLSHFMPHAKFSTDEMQHLYALQVMHFVQNQKRIFYNRRYHAASYQLLQVDSWGIRSF